MNGVTELLLTVYDVNGANVKLLNVSVTVPWKVNALSTVTPILDVEVVYGKMRTDALTSNTE